MTTTDSPVISMRGLGKTYRRRQRETSVLNDVDLDIHPGETLALVGESGSGKTTLARILVGLVEPSTGQVFTLGRDLSRRRHHTRAERARTVQMVFQDPYASMNPRLRIRDVIGEPLVTHCKRELGAEGVRREVTRLLEAVELDPGVAHRYPHDFSASRRQRITTARAVALPPPLHVLLEPTRPLNST